MHWLRKLTDKNMRVSKNTVLRVFGPRRELVAGTEENCTLRNFIIRIHNKSRVSWTGHVTRREKHTKF